MPPAARSRLCGQLWGACYPAWGNDQYERREEAQRPTIPDTASHSKEEIRYSTKMQVQWQLVNEHTDHRNPPPLAGLGLILGESQPLYSVVFGCDVTQSPWTAPGFLGPSQIF